MDWTKTDARRDKNHLISVWMLMKWKWEMEELNFSLLKNASIGSDNGLAPNRQQDIIWNRDDLVYRRKYSSHSFNELKPSWSYFYCCSEMTMSWFIKFWIRKIVKPVIISLENRVPLKRVLIVSYCSADGLEEIVCYYLGAIPVQV